MARHISMAITTNIIGFYAIGDNVSLLSYLTHTFFYGYQKGSLVNLHAFPNEKYDTLH
jgi:hypothetical protein